ncbi:MAG TPA: hypothetical protein VG223_15585 [Solirubrobacteraceae bacterium]|nr:hypothetical protein [Solirubrobacteraceae bacterium]
MHATAVDAEKLRELDDDTRRAWDAYRERLLELTGPEYDDAERESWDELQAQLDGVERRRRELSDAGV